uniref:Epidermal patterning factor-like protein n=1 Tax=Oryza meridionalis TaxID=40149 RepID=A0A0E0CKM3_9ORYZ
MAGHLFLLALLLASSVLAKAAAGFTEEKGVAGIRGVIGSRPPSCEGRCRSCGHCEAVQVPITPQQLQKKGGQGDDRRRKKKQQLLGHGDRAAAAGGRAMPDSYDDHSNYKPLSWRCKCGGMILNP